MVEVAPVGRRFSGSSPKPAQGWMDPILRSVQEEQQPGKFLPLHLGMNFGLHLLSDEERPEPAAEAALIQGII